MYYMLSNVFSFYIYKLLVTEFNLTKIWICHKEVMWCCSIGLKKCMSKNGELESLLYKEHKPGVRIKENSIRNWLDYLNYFKEWELYLPDTYIKKIKK